MPLPKQVQRQAAEADRIVRNLNGANEPPPAPDAAPPVTDPQPDVPIPQPAPTPAPIQVQPPPVQQQQPNEWEQRYHTLQGKYNAEIPALQSQLQNALNTVGNMGREIDTLKENAARVAAAPPAFQQRVTDQDVETWGTDMIEMVRRGAAEEAQKLLAPVLQENAQLRQQLQQVQGQTQQVAQTQQQTREQMFSTRLAEAVPDWNALNTDQGFLNWLGVYDPMLGETRQNALTRVSQALDVDRTIAFFKTYKATLPAPPALTPQQELQRQVTPARTRSGTSPQVATGGQAQTIEIWSQEEINQFYTDLSRGKFRHSPQEAEDMNRRITQAVAEGRVR